MEGFKRRRNGRYCSRRQKGRTGMTVGGNRLGGIDGPSKRVMNGPSIARIIADGESKIGRDGPPNRAEFGKFGRRSYGLKSVQRYSERRIAGRKPERDQRRGEKRRLAWQSARASTCIWGAAGRGARTAQGIGPPTIG